MKRLIFVLTLMATRAAAQDCIAVKETTLVASAEVITIQMPASSAPGAIRFVAAYIDSDVAVTITVERNGTAASSATLAPVAANSTGPVCKAKAWSASNVGTGTVIAKFIIPAGGGIPVGLSGEALVGAGTTKNLTFRTSSITGTVHINVRWTEVQ